MNKECLDCSHSNNPENSNYCCMFEKQPENLPCGQHDKHKRAREIFGRLLTKNPILFQAIVMEAMMDKKFK